MSLVGHPKDPFHRIAPTQLSPCRVELDGAVLRRVDRAYFLFEPPLPVRYDLPVTTSN